MHDTENFAQGNRAKIQPALRVWQRVQFASPRSDGREGPEVFMAKLGWTNGENDQLYHHLVEIVVTIK